MSNNKTPEAVARMQAWFALALIVLAVALMVGLASYLSEKEYKQRTAENCKQYEVYPEEHLDKVPTGCQPQWFLANEGERR